MAVRTFRKITPSYQSISIITRNFTTAVSLFRKDHFPFSCIITRNFATAVSPEKTDMPYAVNSTLSSAKKALSYSESPLETAENKKEATELISRNKCNIQEFCDSVLSGAASYGCSVALRNELFPDRTYSGEIYPAGEYVSLVITLGKGEGGNWWCVAYPPLCFINGKPDPDSPDTVTYRSLLLEWLYGLFGK